MAAQRNFVCLQIILSILTVVLIYQWYIIPTDYWNTANVMRDYPLALLKYKSTILFCALLLIGLCAMSFMLEKNRKGRLATIFWILAFFTIFCFIAQGGIYGYISTLTHGIDDKYCVPLKDPPGNILQAGEGDDSILKILNDNMCTPKCPCPQSAEKWYNNYDNLSLLSLDYFFRTKPGGSLDTPLYYQTDKNGPEFETFQDCWTQVLSKDNNQKWDEKATEIDAYLSAMTSLESQYQCSGVCNYGLFWFTKPVWVFPPQKPCVDSIAQNMEDYMAQTGVSFLIMSGVLSVVMCRQFKMFKAQNSSQVELMPVAQEEQQSPDKVASRKQRKGIVIEDAEQPNDAIEEISPFDNEEQPNKSVVQVNDTEMQLNDEPAIDIEQDLPIEEEEVEQFPLDANNGKLSYSRMIYNRNKTHARIRTVNSQGKEFFWPHPIWKTSTGCLSCRAKDRKSDLERYGVNVVVFFQLLKSLCCIYTVMFILSIPILMIYLNAGGGGLPIDKDNFFVSASIGNLGNTVNACTVVDIRRETTLNFDLSCPESYQVLTRVNHLGVKQRTSGPTAEDTFPGCAVWSHPATTVQDVAFDQVGCSYAEQYGPKIAEIDEIFNAQCYDKQSCKLSLDISLVDSFNSLTGCRNSTNRPSGSAAILTAWCSKPTTPLRPFPINLTQAQQEDGLSYQTIIQIFPKVDSQKSVS